MLQGEAAGYRTTDRAALEDVCAKHTQAPPVHWGSRGTSYSEREIFSTHFPLHCPDPQWPQDLFPRLRRPISLIWQGIRLLLVGLVKVVLFLMSPERPLHDFIFITHILHNMRGDHDEQ